MVFCNPMSCEGFSGATDLMGGCSMVWLGAVLIFFIVVFGRKYLGEAFGMPFSTMAAFVLGYAGYFIGAVLLCSHKFALAIGVVALFVGAFFGGQFLES